MWKDNRNKMDLFKEKLEAGRSLQIAFDDFDGINLI